MTVAVPGFAGRPDKPIQMIRPAHPCDAAAVQLSDEVLEFVFDFIRDRRMNIDILSAKRDYGVAGSECKVVWKTKTGFVVKMPDDAGVRHKRAKTLDAASRLAGDSAAAPLCDGALPIGDEHGEGVASDHDRSE